MPHARLTPEAPRAETTHATQSSPPRPASCAASVLRRNATRGRSRRRQTLAELANRGDPAIAVGGIRLALNPALERVEPAVLLGPKLLLLRGRPGRDCSDERSESVQAAGQAYGLRDRREGVALGPELDHPVTDERVVRRRCGRRRGGSASRLLFGAHAVPNVIVVDLLCENTQSESHQPVAMSRPLDRDAPCYRVSRLLPDRRAQPCARRSPSKVR